MRLLPRPNPEHPNRLRSHGRLSSAEERCLHSVAAPLGKGTHPYAPLFGLSGTKGLCFFAPYLVHTISPPGLSPPGC